MPPNKSPKPTPIGHRSSACAVRVVDAAWLSLSRTTMNPPIQSIGANEWRIRRRLLLLLLLGVSALSPGDCCGQGTVYTSRSEFEAALNSSMTITFETLPPSSIMSIGTSPIIVSGVAFTNLESRLFITSPPGGGLSLYPVPGTGQYLWNYDSGYPVGVQLPEGMTAFGADFSGGLALATTFNATLTATLADGQSYAYNFSGLQGSWSFFGIAFMQPIVSLVYTDGGQNWPGYPPHEEMLDNVSFGTTVPESSTFGGGPPLSITTSNQNVIITWPQTGTNYVLLETGGFDTSFRSNDVVYMTVYREEIISSDNYRTNGTNVFVVLPVDFTGNRFYMLKTNYFSAPPPPQLGPPQTINQVSP
jgi:hypothetical protein